MVGVVTTTSFNNLNMYNHFRKLFKIYLISSKSIGAEYLQFIQNCSLSGIIQSNNHDFNFLFASKFAP